MTGNIHNNGVHDASFTHPDDVHDSKSPQVENFTDAKVSEASNVTFEESSYESEGPFEGTDLEKDLAYLESLVSTETFKKDLKTASEIEDTIPEGEQNKPYPPREMYKKTPLSLELTEKNIQSFDSRPAEKKEEKQQSSSIKEKASQLWESFKSKAKEIKEKFPNFPKPTFEAFKTKLTIDIELPDFSRAKTFFKKQADEIYEQFTSKDGLYKHFNEGGKQILDAIEKRASIAKGNIKAAGSQLKETVEGNLKLKKNPQNIDLERPLMEESDEESIETRERGFVHGKARQSEIKEVAELHQKFANKEGASQALVELLKSIEELKKPENKDMKLKFKDGQFTLTEQKHTHSLLVEGKSAAQAFEVLLEEILKSEEPQHAFEAYQLIYTMYTSNVPQLNHLAKSHRVLVDYYALETYLAKEETSSQLNTGQTRFIWRERTKLPNPKEKI